MAHCELAADHSSDTGFDGGCVDGDFHVGTGRLEGLKRTMSLGCLNLLNYRVKTSDYCCRAMP